MLGAVNSLNGSLSNGFGSATELIPGNKKKLQENKADFSVGPGGTVVANQPTVPSNQGKLNGMTIGESQNPFVLAENLNGTSMSDLTKKTSASDSATNTSGTTRSVFDERGNNLIDSIIGGRGQQSAYAGANDAGVQSLLKTLQGSPIDTYSSYEKEANAIKNQAAAELPKQLAEVRSKFYNAPQGRGDINVADTIARNQAGVETQLASKLAEQKQFDATANQQKNQLAAASANQLANYMDPSQAQTNTENEQALALLRLLRGEDTTGTSRTSQTSSSNDSFLGGITQITGMLGGGMFCWVAREVYGAGDPTWLVYREWMLTEAPSWFVRLYATYGERFAKFISNKPRLKAVIRKWMNARVRGFISN